MQQLTAIAPSAEGENKKAGAASAEGGLFPNQYLEALPQVRATAFPRSRACVRACGRAGGRACVRYSVV